MSYYRRDLSSMFGGPLTPAVKTLIIANVVVYVLQILWKPFTDWFTLVPSLVLPWNFQIWRVASYMFLHDRAGLGHLGMNMLFLFMFGCAIERTWGSRSFYRYYFLCGLGGAAFAFLSYPLWNASILGASGAVYGILIAFGYLFPRQQVLVFFVIPMEARFLVAMAGIFAFASSISGQQGVAHVVHLGGFATGYLLLRWVGVAGRGRRRSLGGLRAEFGGSWRDAYRRWRMKRLRKKFEDYYDKRSGGGDGPMVH